MSRSSRQRIVFVLISASLVVSLLSGGFLGAGPRDDEDDPYKYLSVFTEVLRLVRTVYVEEPDIDTLMAGAMDGATDALDPFSFYVPARRAKSFDGADRVGRQRSGLLVLKERGVAFVASVDPGGAGEKAGVRRGDIISELEERSTRDMPMWELHQFFAAEGWFDEGR